MNQYSHSSTNKSIQEPVEINPYTFDHNLHENAQTEESIVDNLITPSEDTDSEAAMDGITTESIWVDPFRIDVHNEIEVFERGNFESDEPNIGVGVDSTTTDSSVFPVIEQLSGDTPDGDKMGQTATDADHDTDNIIDEITPMSRDLYDDAPQTTTESIIEYTVLSTELDRAIPQGNENLASDLMAKAMPSDASATTASSNKATQMDLVDYTTTEVTPDFFTTTDQKTISIEPTIGSVSSNIVSNGQLIDSEWESVTDNTNPTISANYSTSTFEPIAFATVEDTELAAYGIHRIQDEAKIAATEDVDAFASRFSDKNIDEPAKKHIAPPARRSDIPIEEYADYGNDDYTESVHLTQLPQKQSSRSFNDDSNIQMTKLIPIIIQHIKSGHMDSNEMEEARKLFVDQWDKIKRRGHIDMPTN